MLVRTRSLTCEPGIPREIGDAANNAAYSPKYMKASFQRNNGDGTTTIPTDAQSASDTNMVCTNLSITTPSVRAWVNHGLYIADRNLDAT